MSSKELNMHDEGFLLKFLELTYGGAPRWTYIPRQWLSPTVCYTCRTQCAYSIATEPRGGYTEYARRMDEARLFQGAVHEIQRRQKLQEPITWFRKLIVSPHTRTSPEVWVSARVEGSFRPRRLQRNNGCFLQGIWGVWERSNCCAHHSA